MKKYFSNHNNKAELNTVSTASRVKSLAMAVVMLLSYVAPYAPTQAVAAGFEAPAVAVQEAAPVEVYAQEAMPAALPVQEAVPAAMPVEEAPAEWPAQEAAVELPAVAEEVAESAAPAEESSES